MKYKPNHPDFPNGGYSPERKRYWERVYEKDGKLCVTWGKGVPAKPAPYDLVPAPWALTHGRIKIGDIESMHSEIIKS